jgi:hypothetical protein
MVWHPGVVGIVGDDENAPPSMLYCTVNWDTAATLGKAKAALHVLAGGDNAGAVGKITTFTVLLLPHRPVPAVLAAVGPQAEVRTYLATIEWQPGVVGIVGVDVNVPPSMLNWIVKPATVVTVGRVKAALQVFAGAISVGAVGNTTKFLVSLQATPGVV